MKTHPEFNDEVWVIKQINAYIKGKLSKDEEEKLWIELLKNPEYLDYLETELGVRAIRGERAADQDAGSAGGETRASEGKSFPMNRIWGWFAAAASVGLLFLALYLFQVNGTSGIQGQAVTEIALAEQLATAETTRSEGRAESELNDASLQLARGFEAAVAGKTDRAIQIYLSVTNRFASSTAAPKAYLNLGILHYNRENYSGAAEAFKNSLSADPADPWLKERALWFLGNSYINLEQYDEAKQTLREARSMEGSFESQADDLLNRLNQR